MTPSALVAVVESRDEFRRKAMPETRFKVLLELVAHVLEITDQGELERLLIDRTAELGVIHLRMAHYNPAPVAGTRFIEFISTLKGELSIAALAKRHPQFDDVMLALLRSEEPFDVRSADPGGLREPYRAIVDEHVQKVGMLDYVSVPVLRPNGLEGFGVFMFDKTFELPPIGLLSVRVLVKAIFEQMRALRSPPESETPSPLTARQREALTHCAHGKSDWDISALMGISQSTAHGYIEDAKKRLGVKTRIQAVIVAMQRGWITA